MHQTALLHDGGDVAATLRYCPDAITLLLVCLFHKISGLILVHLEKKAPDQTLKNTDAKYAVTTSGGRQRYNATSTRESLSGANLLQQQQAAARSSDNLQYCYEYRHCCCCCMIRAGYANSRYLVRRFIRVHTSVRNFKYRPNIIKDTKCSSHFRTNWYTRKKFKR